jgi:hypothetical protein
MTDTDHESIACFIIIAIIAALAALVMMVWNV